MGRKATASLLKREDTASGSPRSRGRQKTRPARKGRALPNHMLKSLAYFVAAGAAPSLACCLHSERNFLRSLPCRPLASASFEHSSEAAECTTGFLSIFAAGVAGGGGVLLGRLPEHVVNRRAV